jgi:hypothetical protein
MLLNPSRIVIGGGISNAGLAFNGRWKMMSLSSASRVAA